MENTGELRVSVWDMLAGLLLVGQGADNLSETQQTFVDADALLEELSSGSGLLDSLRTSQINEVEFRGDLFG